MGVVGGAPGAGLGPPAVPQQGLCILSSKLVPFATYEKFVYCCNIHGI